MPKKSSPPKAVEALKHDDAKRKNIPTAEFQSVLEKEKLDPKRVAYPRNRDLDPQLVWRGKDEQDWSDLVQSVVGATIRESQRDSVIQPRVAESARLPWENVGRESQPQRGCGRCSRGRDENRMAATALRLGMPGGR